MIKICHVSTVHPTFDGRIFHKQCVSLEEAGFDVSLIIPHDKNEIVKGIKIIALHKFKSRILRLFFAPIFTIPKVLKTKAKIIQFHDPELLFLGVFFKILGKKVIFDSHENVSHQIETKEWIGNITTRLIVKNIYRLIEKFTFLFYDQIISVTPEIVSFLAPKKGVLIRNYPLIHFVNKINKTSSGKSKTTFIYAGGLTKIRGIKEIINAIENSDLDIELILFGSWETQSYKEECLKSVNKVKYIGVMPLQKVLPELAKADVGFVNFYHEKNHLNCLPTKSFEYMAASLPLIMSDIPYWIERYNEFAKFVDPCDENEIKKAIEWMVNNPEDRTEMGRKGRRIVEEKYSWKAESKKLIHMYNGLCK